MFNICRPVRRRTLYVLLCRYLTIAPNRTLSRRRHLTLPDIAAARLFLSSLGRWCRTSQCSKVFYKMWPWSMSWAFAWSSLLVAQSWCATSHLLRVRPPSAVFRPQSSDSLNALPPTLLGKRAPAATRPRAGVPPRNAHHRRGDDGHRHGGRGPRPAGGVRAPLARPRLLRLMSQIVISNAPAPRR